MASKGVEMALVLVLVVMVCGRAMAQSGCTTAILGMSPCLNYISGNVSTPASSCCSQLGNVVQTQPQCLCLVLSGGSAALGFTLNQTQALTLPSACNLQTPPLSQCDAANGPTTSPLTPTNSPVGSPADSSDEMPEIPNTPSEGSPADSSDETPEIPNTPSDSNIPSGRRSKTVPWTDGTSSDGRNIKAPFHLVLFALFIASCASTATRF